MSTKAVVELTEDDLALAASILRERGYPLRQFRAEGRGAQCLRIAEALCNARVLYEGACGCCGKGSNFLQSCVECGVFICQDCARPTGSHVCDIE